MLMIYPLMETIDATMNIIQFHIGGKGAVLCCTHGWLTMYTKNHPAVAGAMVNVHTLYNCFNIDFHIVYSLRRFHSMIPAVPINAPIAAAMTNEVSFTYLVVVKAAATIIKEDQIPALIELRFSVSMKYNVQQISAIQTAAMTRKKLNQYVMTNAPLI
jgi:hypothetical protein